MADKEDIYLALSDIYDPEIRVNIVDLGLIYSVEINEHVVDIEMTLTAPNCPASSQLKDNVIKAVKLLNGINEVNLNIVWEPSWNPSMISEAARLELGLDVYCENERKW